MALTVIDGTTPGSVLAPSGETPDDSIRLTRREIKQLAGLTGSDPKTIRTRAQLESFVRAHLINYPGRSSEEKLLRHMLESFLSDRLNGT